MGTAFLEHGKEKARVLVNTRNCIRSFPGGMRPMHTNSQTTSSTNSSTFDHSSDKDQTTMTKKKNSWGVRTGRPRKSKAYQENGKPKRKEPKRDSSRDPSVDKTYVIDYDTYSSSCSHGTDELEYQSLHSPRSIKTEHRGNRGKNRRGKKSRSPSEEEEMLSIPEDLLFEFDDQGSESEGSVYYEIVDSDDSDYEEDEKDPSVLPTPLDLSMEFCKLVRACKDNSYTQRRAAFHSLVALAGWVGTNDPTFRKHFLTYGGVVKILDFLKKVLSEEEEHCLKVGNGEKGEFRYRVVVEYIRLVSSILTGLCRPNEVEPERCDNKDQNEEDKSISISVSPRFLAGLTATIVVDHGGIKTLLQASALCCRWSRKNLKSTPDVEASLEACKNAWNAIANTCSCVSKETTAVMIENLFVPLWDAGFDAMEGFSLDTSTSSCPKTNASTFLMRANVFRVFTKILLRHSSDFVKEKEAFVEDILTRVIEILSGKVQDIKDDDASFATVDTGISSISMSLMTQKSISGTKEEEAYIEEALSFLFECQTQNLLFRQKDEVTETVTLSAVNESSLSNGNVASDEWWCRLCEAILPLSVTGLRKYAVNNEKIRKTSIQILNASLSSITKNDQQQSLLTKLTEGTLEALAPCLASEALDELEKKEIKDVVRKIVVVIYSAYIGEFGPSGYNQGV